MRFSMGMGGRRAPVLAAAMAALGALVAPVFADLPIPAAMEGNVSAINWARHEFELKGGNGVSNHVHFGQAVFSEAGKRVGARELRFGEHVRVYSKAFDPTDRGLDATKIEIRNDGPMMRHSARRHSEPRHSAPRHWTPRRRRRRA